MRRALGFLLALFFAAGFTPLRSEPCSCTAERNCGCSCWKTRARAPGATGASGEKACCRLLRGKRGASCGTMSSAHERRSADSGAPLAPSRDHESRQSMEWILAARADLEPPRVGELADLPIAAAARGWLSRPISPPPRAARAA